MRGPLPSRGERVKESASGGRQPPEGQRTRVKSKVLQGPRSLGGLTPPRSPTLNHTLGSWRLERCALYATLEPCPMCAGAIVQARIPYVVYGAADPKAGACETLFRITNDARLNHRAQVIGGVLAEECAAILGEFFASK